MFKRSILLLAFVLVASTAIVVGGSPAPRAEAVQPCATESGDGPQLPIPDFDLTGVTSTVLLVDVTTIDKVMVSVNIAHETDADLQITLTHGATTVTLADRRGGWGNGYVDAFFDDAATYPISAAGSASPITGTYRPELPLKAFQGELSGGTWTLTVRDVSFEDTGTFLEWYLWVSHSCDSDNDGLLDGEDLCPQVAASTASGCPVAKGKTTLKYRTARHRFFGAITSNAAKECVASRTVVVMRKKVGPDTKIGITTSASTGTWKLKKLPRRAKKGHYYAKAAAVTVSSVARCSAITSPVHRVR